MNRYVIREDSSQEDCKQRYVKYDAEFNSIVLQPLYLAEYKGVKTNFTEKEIRQMADKVKWLNWEKLEYINIDDDYKIVNNSHKKSSLVKCEAQQ